MAAKIVTRRILLTGAMGQLGYELHQRLADESIAKPHDSLDLNKHKLVQQFVQSLRPDVLINCAAISDEYEAARDPVAAMQLNGAAVGNLAEACFLADVPFLHISCASVFGDSGNSPYKETNYPQPSTPLGVSKLTGEHCVLQAAEAARAQGHTPRYWIIRLGALFERPWRTYRNVLQRILTISEQPHRRHIALPSDQIISPTSAEDAVSAILYLLSNQPDFQSGVYHIANDGSCSLPELAQFVLSRNPKGRSYSELTFKPIRDILPIAGAAPAALGLLTVMQRYQAMACPRFLTNSDYRLAPWQDAVERFMKDRKRYC